MLAWLDSLTLLEQILLYIAIPATVLLLLQTALLLVVGIGGADGDSDTQLDLDGGDDLSLDLDGDGIPDVHMEVGDLHSEDIHCDLCDDKHEGSVHTGDGTAGLNLLTLRGLVAFFTLFGWSGLLFCQLGLHWLLALFLGIQLGIVGMVAVAFILREALRLQADGTLDIRNALGRVGSVYLTIPAERRGQGKVNVLVQEQIREFEAVTDSETPIPTGAEVIIVAITNGDTLVVQLQL